MPISCEKFLSSALTLLQGFEEVDYRNAASRGYYAAFHVCLTAANAAMLPDIYTGVGPHERLILRLCDSQDNRHKNLGKNLKKIKPYRIYADYKINRYFPKYDAEFVVTYAKRIIEETSTVLP
jgi:uncharacterized protein (UPF0332 family)